MPEKTTRSDGVLMGKKHRTSLKAKLAQNKNEQMLQMALEKEVPFLPQDITCGAIPMCLPASTKSSRAGTPLTKEMDHETESEEEEAEPEKEGSDDRIGAGEGVQEEDGSRGEEGESKDVLGRSGKAKRKKKTESKADQEKAETEPLGAKEPSKSQSFWARWGRGSMGKGGSASLQTGRGNRAVSRSLRDAREDAVCLVRCGSRTGSGFLIEFKGHVGLITNNHLVSGKKDARNATATFCTAMKGSVDVKLCPKEAFFSSDPEQLDYSFIACDAPLGVHPVPLAMKRADTDDYAASVSGSDGLVCVEDMSVKAGDTVTIVQHPEGGEKSIAIGPVLGVKGSSVTYEADTEMGSSGSPVLKDYIPVALHHCAPRGTDSRDGFLSSVSCTPAPMRNYNKGVLLSAILADLDEKMVVKGAAVCVEAKAEDGVGATRGMWEMVGLSGLTCGASRKEEKKVMFSEEKEEKGMLSAVSCSRKREEGKEKVDVKEGVEGKKGMFSSVSCGGSREKSDTEGKEEKKGGGLLKKEVVKARGSEKEDAEEEDEEEEDEEESETGSDEDDNEANQQMFKNPPGAEKSKWSRMCSGSAAPTLVTKATGGKSSKKKERTCGAVLYSSMPSLIQVPEKVKEGVDDDEDEDEDEEISEPGREGQSQSNGVQGSMGKVGVAQRRGGKSSVQGWRRKVEEDGQYDGWSAVSEEDEIMIRAGIAGLGVVADGACASSSAMSITHNKKNKTGYKSQGKNNAQCGVGLVLEAWRPKGLALALNVLSRTYEAVRVDQVVFEGPAALASPKIEPGDLLREVDGQIVTSLGHAKSLLVGKPGTSVTLKIVRNQYLFDVIIVRNFPGAPPIVLEVQNEDVAELEELSESKKNRKSKGVDTSEKEARKYVLGIPTLYKRDTKHAVSANKGSVQAQGSGSPQSAQQKIVQDGAVEMWGQGEGGVSRVAQEHDNGLDEVRDADDEGKKGGALGTLSGQLVGKEGNNSQAEKKNEEDDGSDQRGDGGGKGFCDAEKVEDADSKNLPDAAQAEDADSKGLPDAAEVEDEDCKDLSGAGEVQPSVQETNNSAAG